jgi:hypothetical protein
MEAEYFPGTTVNICHTSWHHRMKTISWGKKGHLWLKENRNNFHNGYVLHCMEVHQTRHVSFTLTTHNQTSSTNTPRGTCTPVFYRTNMAKKRSTPVRSAGKLRSDVMIPETGIVHGNSLYKMAYRTTTMCILSDLYASHGITNVTH